MLLFALETTDRAFADALASDLDVTLSPYEERLFEDGERKLRPLINPRGEDAYVVHSLYGGPVESPHDKLVRLLMFIATLHEHGARRVTAVVPYLAYARKDRQTKEFDPVAQRHVARMIESVGTSQIIGLEVHNVAAFQNAFRIPTVHLAAHQAFGPAVEMLFDEAPLAVASPDSGGTKRAQLWREDLESRLKRPIGFAMVDKRRSGGVLSSSDLVAGDVARANVLLLDDLIATGETMQRAAQSLKRSGAHRVIACAAHGLFVGAAGHVLTDGAIDHVFVTDSVPAFRLQADARPLVQVVSCAGLFAQAIRASHASWTS